MDSAYFQQYLGMICRGTRRSQAGASDCCFGTGPSQMARAHSSRIVQRPQSGPGPSQAAGCDRADFGEKWRSD